MVREFYLRLTSISTCFFYLRILLNAGDREKVLHLISTQKVREVIKRHREILISYL